METCVINCCNRVSSVNFNKSFIVSILSPVESCTTYIFTHLFWKDFKIISFTTKTQHWSQRCLLSSRLILLLNSLTICGNSPVASLSVSFPGTSAVLNQTRVLKAAWARWRTDWEASRTSLWRWTTCWSTRRSTTCSESSKDSLILVELSFLLLYSRILHCTARY